MPVMLTLSPALPGATLVGARLLAAGTGLLTVNVFTTDGFPPGFATVTNGVPATAIAAAGIAADSCVEFTKAEDTVLEPKVTTDEGPKPVPVIASVNCMPPAVALAGTIDPMVGCEFDARTVSVAGDEDPPPDPSSPSVLVMAIPIAAGFAISAAKIAVVT